MSRQEIVRLCERQAMDDAGRLFGTRKEALRRFPDYEGCANLVFEYDRADGPHILRISFRPDRPAEQIQAELHFIEYLADHGVRVSRPVRSENGNLLETVVAAGMAFHVVSFVRGRGTRVPDNDYRYRPDAPIDEYYQNWGRVLGQMHALSKQYRPVGLPAARPDWFASKRPVEMLQARVPERLPVVRRRILALLEELGALPRGRDSYGLIHCDLNDGNFIVDYSNGEITVFDFDDCCYSWFVYELASAWEGGIGRTMFRGPAERRAFMDHYFEQVIEGYQRENSLDSEWLARLPLFLKLVQVEEFLHFAQYLDEPDPEMQGELRYKIRCIEEDIPYLGFFDPIYSPERPFSL